MRLWFAYILIPFLLVAPIAAAAPDILIADFEGDTYGDWQVTGAAFGRGPARGTLPDQNPVTGFQGKGLVNTYHKGDNSQGTLTSPPFTIQRKYINFLIGGGNRPDLLCINLLIDGKITHTATGHNNEILLPAAWDVSRLAGKSARIQIVDKATGGWDHINIDQIVQSDTAATYASSFDPEAARAAARQLSESRGVKDIIFAVRKIDGDGHWYANFSYWSNSPDRLMYHDGGRLCRLNLATGAITNLIDDPKGGVRDPQVHYDGKKILFSYRKGGQPFYNLYEIDIDGANLRQITSGQFDDIEPVYLPDGDILFCSSRCNRFVNCWFTRVAVIYRCRADGSDIHPLSANIEQDNTPWVLPDGRILYMRWEYIDRSQVSYHHLWTMYPDGTNQMIYWGNQMVGTVTLDAKPIPNTNKVVSVFSPGHGRNEHSGAITIVDPGAGPDARPSAHAIPGGQAYRDPFPLSENCFLVTSETARTNNRDISGADILVLDGKGQATPIYQLPDKDIETGLKVHEPRPILPRPRETIIPTRTRRTEPTGQVVLANVYQGRNMEGVKPGEIKKLLILEALPKPVNFSGGWEPLTFGGTFTLERVLGSVPVEPDGSAFMELPALRSIFFVALDQNNLAIKRMQSFLTVQPGETFGCVGCHEQRTRTMPATAKLMATRRPASRIEPYPDTPDVFDFPRDIQPILDKHCLACHDYDAHPLPPTAPANTPAGPRAGGVILTADRGPVYSHSYVALTVRGQFSDGRNLARSNYPPRALGSFNSPLLKKLDGSHYGAKLSDHERDLIRLWIDSAAPYPGTYAALGCGMVGDAGWGPPVQTAVAKRCASCHTGPTALPKSPADWLGISLGGGVINNAAPNIRFLNHIIMNLSRPEKSLLLLAPLAKSAGGFGLCKTSVFTNTADPDYQTLLTALCASQSELNRIKRFDMPGFRPNAHYLREMKVYGILPANPPPDAPVDPYSLDRAYWKSLWHQPASQP